MTASAKPPGRLPDIVVANQHARFTGVSATVAALVPLQQEEREIAVVDTGGLGLSGTWPLRSVVRAGWSATSDGRPRIWHARRDVEMLTGLWLKYGLGQNWRLVFTSAAPRRHGRVLRGIMGRMDAIIATSERAASHLDWYTTVVPHGVDTDDFTPPPDKAAAVATSGIPARYLIGCFGRLRESKGTDLAVEALCATLPDRPDWGAFFTGLAKDESYISDLKSKIESAGLSDRVRFLGDLEAEAIRDWYRRTDILLAASRTEGFGLTPLEGMASGAMAVTSGAGYWPELIRPGVNGARFATGDAADLARVLSPFLDDPNHVRALGLSARTDVVAHHSIRAEVAGIHDLYDRLRAGPLDRRDPPTWSG
ncbi:glycosyltransferase family 4 protein [Oceanomicrobium pacificus]|uniref:Glycosyltransferase n=1 Tax=Oceanomicrobium pacificus TaxID=2692916 RepID=A0A6B0TVQ4_9RHOB|nr:glycosyltransferase family 4 protein [Oceanomicrobium pacificus]MXU65855.1 glycosyltransferase [Oceanomicrobium pacificus]